MRPARRTACSCWLFACAVLRSCLKLLLKASGRIPAGQRRLAAARAGRPLRRMLPAAAALAGCGRGSARIQHTHVRCAAGLAGQGARCARLGCACLPACAPVSHAVRGPTVPTPLPCPRSAQSVGSGEFLDLLPLVDLCAVTGFSLIQARPLPTSCPLTRAPACLPACLPRGRAGAALATMRSVARAACNSPSPPSHTHRNILPVPPQVLPVSDTSVRGTWRDSYPYSSLCVFALHPLYLRLQALAGGLGRT